MNWDKWQKLVITLAILAESAAKVSAQTFVVLHTFTNGIDGANPCAAPVIQGSKIYGTAPAGGSANNGTIFKLNSDGTGFVVLHSFCELSNTNKHEFGTNSDGAHPSGNLALSGGTLFGTAFHGGTGGRGTVFKVDTDGTGFTTLHSFARLNLPFRFDSTNSDGAEPFSGVVLSGEALFGATYTGGNGSFGTIYRLNTNGSGFTTLHHFTNGMDGALPFGGLVVSGNKIYGVAEHGGSDHEGTVFRLNSDGTGFVTLHSFTALNAQSNYTNSDGAMPRGGLFLSGNLLYGTTWQGGNARVGTAFKLKTDGTEFAILHHFADDREGSLPCASMVLFDDNLYGSTQAGGSGRILQVSPEVGLNGTLFKIRSDGTDFATLHSFGDGGDGAVPWGLVLSGTRLYGITAQGGKAGYGTLFALILRSASSAPKR